MSVGVGRETRTTLLVKNVPRVGAFGTGGFIVREYIRGCATDAASNTAAETSSAAPSSATLSHQMRRAGAEGIAAFALVFAGSAVIRRPLTGFLIAALFRADPDWWKLPPCDSDDEWRSIEAVIRANDSHCRGVLVLGVESAKRDLHHLVVTPDGAARET